MVTKLNTQPHLVNIAPDVRLLRVLRNAGINNLAAIGEFVDNSLDAGGSKIDLYFQEDDGNKIITIVDNGKGMGLEVLQRSLVLAKEMKNGFDHLGKFGMGMKIAALSLTTKMEIFTKSTKGYLSYAEFNLNQMESIGDFFANVRPASPEEIDFFHSKTNHARSGTIIILTHCDHIETKTMEKMAKHVETYIGQTYRNYIARNVKFTVSTSHLRGNEVVRIDPLMRDHDQTTLICEREPFPITYLKNGTYKTSFIEVSAVVLPKSEKKGKIVDGKSVPLTINPKNQGFYFLREGREVGKALVWPEIFGTRHPSKNRYRLEIMLHSDIDDEMGMDFGKRNIKPKDMFKEQLKDILGPILDEMKKVIGEDEFKEVQFTARTKKTPLSKAEEALKCARKVRSALKNDAIPSDIKRKILKIVDVPVIF